MEHIFIWSTKENDSYLIDNETNEVNYINEI